MAKKDDPKIKKNITDMNILDNISKKILSNIDPNYTERDILNAKDAKFQAIINREIDMTKGVSNGSIIDFTLSQLETGAKSRGRSGIGGNPVDSDNIFTDNVGEIFSYFQDVYKNKFVEMTDLKFVSKFIPALGEAVKTTLDHVVSSDDISSTITRTLMLSSSIEAADVQMFMAEIKKIEKEEKLLKKLKNIVYKKTLVTGSFYVYAIAYKDLYAEYDRLKAKGRFNDRIYNSNVTSSKVINSKSDKGFNMASESENMITMESFSNLFDDMKKDEIDDTDITQFKSNLESHIGSISIIDKEYGAILTALESVNDLKHYNDTFKGNTVVASGFADGTADADNPKTSDAYSEISGTYVKYIDSKNIIPMKIFNQVAGYYYIHATKRGGRKGTNISASDGLFNSLNFSDKRKDDIMRNVVNVISDGILTNFSPKFALDHSDHRRMIADCIIANGIIDNDYNIQFIPAEQMVEFMINEDEDGYGESILADSLFPAKLLLSLIISKMLTYMNKSGNRTIAHVFKGPIDTNSGNQLNRVVRMLQDSQITFNDLLSPNMTFSKFARDSNIQLPTSRNGSKIVEFETQEGQHVDLKTDFEDKLEEMAIVGTGVPSIIMEYANSIDYAKQITSASIKFAGRISSLQADLEDPTTILYKILITNSNLEEGLKTKCLQDFQFKLPRPKALANSNNSEFIKNSIDNARSITELLVNASGKDDAEKAFLMSDLILKIVKNDSQFLEWDVYEDMFNEAMLEYAKKLKLDDGASDDDGGGMGY